MRDLKLIVTGSMGAGKTTAIGTISDRPPIRTEVPVAGEATRPDKTTTTVALDYGTLTLEGGRRLLIFGTPGQRRFDFMAPILARDALGVIVLIDHAGADPATDLAYYLDLYAEAIAQSGAVIGLTHTDESPADSLDAYYEILGQRDLALPIFSIDARSRDDFIVVIEALLAMIE